MLEQNAKLDDYRRFYVIGDIHGRADLLEKIIEAIRRDLGGRAGDDCLTITLGDYVDRGPQSRKVLDRLAKNPFPTRYMALKGNHEVLLESFMVEPQTADTWRRLGGLETLHSYGIPVSQLMVGRGYDEAAAALRAAFPDEHLQFLSLLKTSTSSRRYFLCHAGIRPGVPFERQSADDLMWIRGEFLNSTMDFGKVVVHGHSPVEKPHVLPNRINIDTGAFATGRLTCLVIDGEERRFLSTA